MDAKKYCRNLNIFLEGSTGLQQLLTCLPQDLQFEVHVGRNSCFYLSKQKNTWAFSDQPVAGASSQISFSPDGIETLLKSQCPTKEAAVDVLIKLFLAEMLRVDFKSSTLALFEKASTGAFHFGTEKIRQALKTAGLDHWSRKILR